MYSLSANKNIYNEDHAIVSSQMVINRLEVEGDRALEEITRGLIHAGYAVTIDPMVRVYRPELVDDGPSREPGQLEQLRARVHDTRDIYPGGGSSTPVPSAQTYATSNTEVGENPINGGSM